MTLVRAATLVVIAKEPLPGRVKTRLCPPLDHAQAAALAEASLADTLLAVAATAAHRRVLVLEGSRGPWLPAGFEIIAQRGDGLAERLANATRDVGEALLLVGMDTPQLTPGLLRGALARLADPAVDAVLGPTADGGYWTIGLQHPDPRAFDDVPMSRDGTGAAQLARLTALGLRTECLGELRDVDTIEDAATVAALAPATRFATAYRRLMRPGA